MYLSSVDKQLYIITCPKPIIHGTNDCPFGEGIKA
jgi:hypothetical protein